MLHYELLLNARAREEVLLPSPESTTSHSSSRRMSKQTRSQTTKHGEPELSAPSIGGEDAAHIWYRARGLMRADGPDEQPNSWVLGNRREYRSLNSS